MTPAGADVEGNGEGEFAGAHSLAEGVEAHIDEEAVRLYDEFRVSNAKGFFSDLVAAAQNIGTARDWFVEGVIEGNPIVTFAGPEKGGKSWQTIDLCVAAVLGGKWLGRFPVLKPGPAVYIDGEMGTHEFTRRATRVARAHGVDPRLVLPRLRHFAAQALELHFEPKTGDGPTKGNPTIERLGIELRQLGPSIVIIDPWRNFLAGNENDSRVTLDALKAVAALQRMARSPVIILHHLNKEGSIAGSRAIMTRPDLVIVGTDEDQPWYGAKGRTIRHSDPIGGGKRWTVSVRHDDDDDDTVATTHVACRFEGETHATAAMSTTASKLLAAIKRNPSGATASKLRQDTKINGEAAKRGLAELETAGIAECRDGKWRESTQGFFRGLGSAANDAS